MAIKQRLELDVRQYQQNLNTAKRSLRDFARDVDRSGRDMGRSFERGARDAERAVESSTSRMGRAFTALKGIIGVTFAVELIRRFGTALVTTANQTEQIRVRFEALTGSAAKARQHLDQIQKFAQSKGLAFPALATAVQTMTSFGMKIEDVMKNLDAISTGALLSPDGMQAGMERIGRALGQIAGNGRLAAEEMNQLSEAGLPAWKLLAESMGLVEKHGDQAVAKLREMVTAGKVSADVAIGGILAGLRKNYPKLLQEYARSAEGLSNRFKEVFRKGLETMGQPLFGEITKDLRSLSTSMNDLEKGGSLGRTMREMGVVLKDIYVVLRDILGIVGPLVPELTRLGAAFLAFKGVRVVTDRVTAATAAFVSFSTALAKLGSEGPKLGTTLEANVSKRVDRLARGLRAVAEQGDAASAAAQRWAKQARDMGAEPIPKWDPSKYTNKTEWRADQALIRAWHNQVDRAKIKAGEFATATDRMSARMRILGRTAASVGARLGTGLLALLGGWPGVIAAAVTALVYFGSKLGWFNDKIKGATEDLRKYREQIRKLQGDLETMDDFTKGAELFKARKIQVELEMKDPTQDPEIRKLPAKLRQYVIDQLRQGNEEVFRQILGAYSLTSPMTVGQGGVPHGQLMGLRELEKMGLSRQDVATGEDALRILEDRFKLLQEYHETTKKLNEEARNNYYIQLGALQAEERALQATVKKTDADRNRLAEIRREIEYINKMLAPAEPKKPDTTTDKVNVPDGMSVQELTHALELLEAKEQLKSALSEIHRTAEQITALEKEQAEIQAAVVALRKKGEDVGDLPERVALYGEYIDALYKEQDALTKNYNRQVDVLHLYENLTPAVKQLVDEMGGINEVFEKGITTEQLELFAKLGDGARDVIDQLGGLEEVIRKGITPEKVGEALPFLTNMSTWAKQLGDELQDIQNQLDLGTLEEETARKMAEAAVERYRAGVISVVEEIKKLDLPEPLKDMLDQLVDQLSGMIGSNTSAAVTDAEALAKAYEKQAEALEKSAAAMERFTGAGRALYQVANNLGVIGRATQSLLSGLLDAADAMVDLRRTSAEIARINAERAAQGLGPLSQAQSAAMAIPGAIGIVAGVLQGFTGLMEGIRDADKRRREEAEQHRQELRRIQDSLRSYQQAIKDSIERLFSGGRTGGDLRRSAIDSAQGFVAALEDFYKGLDAGFVRPGGRGRDTYHPGQYTQDDVDKARDMFAELDALGIFDADLVGMFDTILESNGDLRGTIAYILKGVKNRYWDVPDGMEFEGIEDAIEQLGEELGNFTDDLAGAIDAVSFFARFMGEDAVAQFKRFMEALLNDESELFKKLDEDLVEYLKEAQGLDLTTQEGRTRLQEIITAIAAAFPQFMGDLTNDELERLLAEMQRMLDDAANGSTSSGEDEFTRNVQWLRTITEAQAHEMVVLLKEISYYLRQMYQHFTGGAIYVPPVPNTSAASTATGSAQYVAQFGDVYITANWDRLAQTAGRELERKVQRKKQRAF